MGGRPALWGVSVGQAEARDLARFVLLALHGRASVARLTTLLVNQTIRQAGLTLSEPTPVMIRSDRVQVCVTPLLLRRGPDLEAQRVSVRAAHAATA